MDNQTKKIPILVVTYHFPPRGGVSVQRIVKFIKYLPNHGFQPIVLTVNKPLGSVAEDIEMMEEVPDDVRIFRSESFEPYHIYRALEEPRGRMTHRSEASLLPKPVNGGLHQNCILNISEGI